MSQPRPPAPPTHVVLLTTDARRALILAGNHVQAGWAVTPSGRRLDLVTLVRPPHAIEVVEVVEVAEPTWYGRGVRLSDERMLTGETGPICGRERAAWLPCPACGAPLVDEYTPETPSTLATRRCWNGHVASISRTGAVARAVHP
ncbi:MAG TPA: hypothetical protein VNM34_14865 [Verrucomicrobiae bacterium]|nr:hypothetical protein [Verrucomicrobiae bacterium]